MPQPKMTLDFSSSPTGVDANLHDYPRGEYSTVIGSAFDDQIHGTSSAHILDGGAGDDTLKSGHHGAIIDGGAGADSMWAGKGGVSEFVFDSVSDFGDGTSWDTIYRFTKLDLLNLRNIDADTTQSGHQAFSFIGTNAFDGHPGELRYGSDGHGGSIVEGDVNGDGAADFQLDIAGKPQMFGYMFEL